MTTATRPTTTADRRFQPAAWFTAPRSIDTPEGGSEREDVLNDVYRFTAFAARGDVVAVRTPNGRALLEARTVRGCRLVDVDYVPAGRVERVSFRMNASSLSDLGDRLRAAADKRADFDTLFLGG
jgi:hypothetical protein